MVLSDEQKDALRARYEVWGLEAVRAEVERDQNDPLAVQEVTAFAREWVDGEQMRQDQTIRSFMRLTIGAVVLFVGTVAIAIAT